MKMQADKKRRDKTYAIGDRVYLKLQPYRQGSVAARSFRKLRHKYYGPYEITARVGTVAYRLALPKEATIHNVFHVSQLKDGTNVPLDVSPSLPPFTVDGELRYHPARILKRRSIRSRGRTVPQVLVAWDGLPESEATWEDYDSFHATFHLEDKVGLHGGSHDSNQIATVRKGSPSRQHPGTRAWVRAQKDLDAGMDSTLPTARTAATQGAHGPGSGARQLRASLSKARETGARQSTVQPN